MEQSSEVDNYIRPQGGFVTKEELPEISVITLVFDADSYTPEVNLGNVHPQLAIVAFTKAIEALEAIIPGPTIIYDDEVVYSEFFSPDEEDLD